MDPQKKTDLIKTEVERIIALVHSTDLDAAQELYETCEAAFDYRSAAVYWQELYGRCVQLHCPTIKNPSIRSAIQQAYGIALLQERFLKDPKQRAESAKIVQLLLSLLS